MSFSISEILEWTDGRLANERALGSRVNQIRVERASPLGVSGPQDIAFFFSRNYEKELMTARPAALITAEPFVKPLESSGLPIWNQAALIVCKDPYFAMALVSEKIAAKISTVSHVPERDLKSLASEIEVHASAIVHPSAILERGVQVGPYCVIEKGAKVGARSILYPGCYLGPSVVVGEDCVLFPRVSLYEWTEIGNRVRLHAGSVLGSDGFGYAPKREGRRVLGHQKIYHLGRVVVGDDVEIGANSCVDRGTFGETRIEKSAKLDNLVHIGHNAHLDEGAVICGGTCLAGRASVGRFAYIGGLTGITNDVHVGDGAQVGAVSLVTKDVPPGSTAVGNPQREYKEHFRAHAMLNRMVSKRGKGEGEEKS